MMEGQGDQRCSVPGFNGEDIETVIEDSLLDELLIGNMQGVLLDAQLDRDLRVAGRADELDVDGIDDGILGGATQLRIAQVEPKQGVGVEEQPHGT
jgi:hypothetical protein